MDRHLRDRADQAALIFVSTETDQEKVYSFRELHAEVQRMAAVLLDLGVQKGDRVLIYMPMVAEAAFAMLACARIGADAQRGVWRLCVRRAGLAHRRRQPHGDRQRRAGSRGGEPVAYKPLLDEAIRSRTRKPSAVLRDRTPARGDGSGWRP